MNKADSPDKPVPSVSLTPLTLAPFVLLFLIYLPTLWELVVDWYQDPNYSHGFLIPLVSGYLLWKQKGEFATVPRTSGKGGLVLVIIGLVMFVVANGAAEYFTLRVSFLVVLVGLVWLIFGGAFVRKTWFEWFFLIFMIPIPYVVYYAISFPMQLLASKVTATLLNAVGLAAIRQGNIIHLADYSLEVAEACSGIRSLVSLVALGALFAYLTQRGVWPRLLLIASTVPVAVAGNVVRVLVTAILVFMIGDEVAQEPAHSLLGLLVFVVALITLPVIGWILRKIFR
jgi:exosortase